ncbi:hypothetical protein CTAYLR_005862 [Chrysophaeum taylorii]|uniref:PDZ domain-containing protein n=1 Tax=Chrysophaeum taylorii TaxID=2483200 RepID=A0AAD7UIW0_9STRA|nr:hypothetical protein CTAYLR_005862 [Chrysophaeum taylorii]
MEVVDQIKDACREHYLQVLSQLASPPRLQYAIEELGPREFTFGGRSVRRRDSKVLNERGHSIAFSVWEPPAPRGMVVYVPDALDCRSSVVDVLAPILAAGCACCALDTTGCGSSEGRHVTIGYFERYDVACVVSELGEYETVVAMGRGSGAVAALLFADSRDHDSRLRSRNERLVRIPCLPGIDGAVFEKASRMYMVSKPPLRVSRVEPGSSADRAGILVGDVVAGVDDEAMLPHTHDELEAAFAWRAAARREATLWVARREGLEERDLERCSSRKLSLVVLDAPWTTVGALVWDLVGRVMDRPSRIWSPLVSASLSIVLHSLQKRSLADLGAIDARVSARRASVPVLVMVDNSHPVLAPDQAQEVASYAPAATVVDYDGPRSLREAALPSGGNAFFLGFDPQETAHDSTAAAAAADRPPLRSDDARRAIFDALQDTCFDYDEEERENSSSACSAALAALAHPWSADLEASRRDHEKRRDLLVRRPQGDLVSSRNSRGEGAFPPPPTSY